MTLFDEPSEEQVLPQDFSVVLTSKDPEKSFVLAGGQASSFDFLTKMALNQVPQRKAVLVGYAGTGKSFVINRVVESVKKKNPRIAFGMTAPTHKAVRVLKKLSELANMLDFGTIHSFLALKQKQIPDPKDKRKHIIVYEPDRSNHQEKRIDGINVLIVDEASMLSDELFEYIEDEMRSNERLKVIYMGDPKQIPPVGKKQKTGEAIAIPFLSPRQESHKIHILELTEPQRQAKESPIIMYATAIREQSDCQYIDFEFKPEYEHALQRLSAKEITIKGMREIFLQYFKTEQFEEDTDYVKVVAWRNDTVDYFNREIRLLINGVDILPKIITDEKLIMDEPLMDTKGDKKSILLSNNEEVKVVGEVEIVEHIIKYKLLGATKSFDKLNETGSKAIKEFKAKAYRVVFTTPEGKIVPALIIHEDSEKEFEELKETIKQSAIRTNDQWDKREMWRQFYSLNENFAWVKYNYCLTAHKAQGSTYDYCISMEWDIEENRDIEERNMIRYVSATRARHKLFVIKR